MQSLVISFLGRDCPGVVAAVSSLFEEAHCDIVMVSQTISNGEFAAIFTVLAPPAVTVQSLHAHLTNGLVDKKIDLSVMVRHAIAQAWGQSLPCSPFVVTAHGPNTTGLMAALSSVFARHNVNIENLKALMDEDGKNNALFVFEVMVPENVDLQLVRQELLVQGEKYSLRISVQHRDIFEAIHRISPM